MTSDQDDPGLASGQLHLALRKRVAYPSAEAVAIGHIDGNHPPLLVQSRDAEVDLSRWCRQNHGLLDSWLLTHGAILFRGFGLCSASHFQAILAANMVDLLPYMERSTPRKEILPGVYTSTEHPERQPIFLHNENSYQLRWPIRLFFFCERAASSGGETWIADCRRVLSHVSPEIRKRFAEKEYAYVRNFGRAYGLPWQTAFQTTDHEALKSYCRANQIECKWRADGGLTTRQVRPAVRRHPVTGEEVWFNHATFFHVSTLEPALRESLLSVFKLDELPNQTYYGDGTMIEDETMETLRSAYLAERIAVPWQDGDLLLLDNMLYAHGRNRFEGSRQVLVAMSQMVEAADL